MAIHNVWECNVCGHKVRTNGSWEFYRDASGQRKPYGHPRGSPMMTRKSIMKIRDKTRRHELLEHFESWCKRQPSLTVDGFSKNLYCRECDKVKDVIIYEFEHPVDVDIAWRELIKPDYRKAFVLWFAVRPAGFKSVIRWLRTMPTDSFKAKYYWDSKQWEQPCPVCGGELLWSLKELKCPRCKEGMFDRVHSGMS